MTVSIPNREALGSRAALLIYSEQSTSLSASLCTVFTLFALYLFRVGSTWWSIFTMMEIRSNNKHIFYHWGVPVILSIMGWIIKHRILWKLSQIKRSGPGSAAWILISEDLPRGKTRGWSLTSQQFQTWFWLHLVQNILQQFAETSIRDMEQLKLLTTHHWWCWPISFIRIRIIILRT